jgi:hypothetical protein
VIWWKSIKTIQVGWFVLPSKFDVIGDGGGFLIGAIGGL